MDCWCVFEDDAKLLSVILDQPLDSRNFCTDEYFWNGTFWRFNEPSGKKFVMDGDNGYYMHIKDQWIYIDPIGRATIDIVRDTKFVERYFGI